MPNVYRKKSCPACGVEHRRRGPYCSRSCATKGRVLTDEHKEKLRQTTKRFMNGNSDNAEKVRWIIAQQAGNKGITVDEIDDAFPVPPEDPGFGDYEIDSDGDLWR